MKFEEFKKRILKDSKTQKAYSERDIAFEIGLRVANARIFRGLTQEKLAKLAGMQQSAIARIESGLVEAKNSSLDKIGKAMKIDLVLPNFSFKPKFKIESSSETKTVSKERNIIESRNSDNINIKALINV